ncbi:hypothetical protein ABGB09_30215 [Streptomyces sp. B8F3]|uniref:hypothetical protein n=1 Tax=Streptomyces sp. B8F3 TaxID=3153573 RepID=UPI00325CEB04
MQTTGVEAIPLAGDAGSVEKLARLAWIAEQYGFAYADALQVPRTPLTLFTGRWRWARGGVA